MPSLARDLDYELHQFIASCANNPLRFVEKCYTWPIHGEDGPDTFQRDFLERLGEHVRTRAFDGSGPVLPIRMGTSSGHGIGKTALTAWVTHWLLATRRKCRGTVTANTFDQLEKKTWAAVREWHTHLLPVLKDWFVSNANRMYRVGFDDGSWQVAPLSCAEENSEAFQGQHAKQSTSFYVFDEASAIPDAIWNAAEGGLTSGEDMFFAFGNPTRNSGMFHRIAFGDKRERWDIRIIDSRESKFSNKQLIQEWLEDYSEESDFFRVRVRGLPPAADELQYIGMDRIRAAQTNVVPVLTDEPLVAGCDVSGGGGSMTVLRFRRGMDARSIKPIRLTGEQTNAHDRQLAISRIAQACDDHQPQMVFFDAAFGAVFVQRLKQLGYPAVEVNFGAPSPSPVCHNMRAWMYHQLREWLPKGMIDQHDTHLATDLSTPGYHLNRSNKLVIEDKQSVQKRGGAPLHDSDALALCFAMPVRLAQHRKSRWGAVSASPYG